MNSNLSQLYQVLASLQECIGREQYNEGYLIAKEALKVFPYSTELIDLYLTLAQLSDQGDISLSQIKDELSELMKLQNHSNFQVLIDNLGIKHNVFDEKSEDMKILFDIGYHLMMKNVSDFMNIYFDYLVEAGEKQKIPLISDTFQKEISSLNDKYLLEES